MAMTRLRACCLALFCAWMLPTLAFSGSTTPTVAATTAPKLRWPANPIASRAQLEAYLHDTPAAASPLSAFTLEGRRRFLASLVFHERGLGGFGTDDLGYDLTREQAWNVLRLFGEQNYAGDLAARTRPRAPDARPVTLEATYDRLAEMPLDRPSNVPAAFYADTFAQAQGRLEGLADLDVELLLRAAHRLTYADPAASRFLDDMRRDFAELERRHRADRPHAEALYRALLAAHRTDQARKLLAAWPTLERQPPPTMHDAGGLAPGQASLWVARGKRDLWRQPLVLDDDAQVVVLGSTGCHFSEAAARSIDADPALRGIFRTHAQWLAPAHDIVAFDALQAWNRAHSAQPLAILDQDAGLPFISRFETPTFYFLQHGRVVDTVVGWPGDEQRAALRQALRRIGLLSQLGASGETP
jgi:hypothetical protein